MDDNLEQQSLSIYCLDGFKVYRGQDLIPPQKWRRQKVTLLFQYLLVADKPVPRHILLSLFWPHLEEAAARHNLAVTLYDLRRTLQPKHPTNQAPLYIKSVGSYIELDWNSVAFYDVQAFKSFYREGVDAFSKEQWDQAVAALIAANKLYQTDFIPDAQADWIIEERAWLKNVRLDVLEHLAEALFKLGRYREAYTQAQALVKLDSCREEGHRILMKILNALGHRSQAIVQYQECKQVLEKELGIQPDSKTNNLYQQIVSGESH